MFCKVKFIVPKIKILTVLLLCHSFGNKAFNITKNLKYDGYESGLASMVYKFFDKKFATLADKSTKGSCVNKKIKQNEQLAEELQNPIIKNF